MRRDENEAATGPDSRREDFFPRGTIVFFAAMILVYAGLWFAMYGLMSLRG